MVRLKDIAKRCGVSVASVSKAINHMPGVGVQTAKRIRDTARAMGYGPHVAAQTACSFLIGVLLAEEGHQVFQRPYFAAVLDGFRSKMEARGFDLMLLNRTLGEHKVSYLEHCRYSRLDGVLVVGSDGSDPQLQELAASKLPLVSIDHSYQGHPSVHSDHVDGILQAVSRAIQLGHRAIACISGTPGDVTNQRLEGYHKAMAQADIPVNPQYLFASRYCDVESAYAATRELLALPIPPTCILMPDDYAALGGQMAIQDLELRFPEDVSLIGFGGLAIFEHLRSRLTTVAQDAVAIGQQAAKLLLRHIDKKGSETAIRAVKMPVHFVEGATLSRLR